MTIPGSAARPTGRSMRGNAETQTKRKPSKRVTNEKGNNMKRLWYRIRHNYRMVLLGAVTEVCRHLPGDFQPYYEEYTEEGHIFVGVQRGSYEQQTLSLVLRVSGQSWMFDKDGNYDYA